MQFFEKPLYNIKIQLYFWKRKHWHFHITTYRIHSSATLFLKIYYVLQLVTARWRRNVWEQWFQGETLSESLPGLVLKVASSLYIFLFAHLPVILILCSFFFSFSACTTASLQLYLLLRSPYYTTASLVYSPRSQHSPFWWTYSDALTPGHEKFKSKEIRNLEITTQK